jgi:uncharacterized protein YeaC (DUF1315 family)
VLEGPYSEAEIDAAVEALQDPDRLAGAQDTVARIAPSLQVVLSRALESGGWFGGAHAAEVRKAAALGDTDKRAQAVGLLLAEETRLGMLVGVAVGIELARELAKHPDGHAHDDEPKEPDA